MATYIVGTTAQSLGLDGGNCFSFGTIQQNLFDTERDSVSLGSKSIHYFYQQNSGYTDEDVLSFVISIQNLLNKYRMFQNAQDTLPSSGGLQQFILRKMRQKSEIVSDAPNSSWTQKLRAIYTKDPPSAVILQSEDDGCFIKYLPVDVKLKIFSYLDARSLCQACCVCQDWSQLTCDPCLWRCLLSKDSKQWTQISYTTNPHIYLADETSNWSLKEIYLKCSPAFQQQLRAATSTFQRVSSVIRSFIPRKVPRVAILGPGLESLATSCLIRHLLYEDNQTFRRIAMFPGQYGGVGGGITLQLPAGHSLHLSVLYSATRKEREQRGGAGRLEGNKLLQKLVGAAANREEETPQYELNPNVRQLCQSLDAFIFVVDATQSHDEVSSSREELQTVLRERQSTLVPVLIMSCVARPGDARIPTCDVVECLDLASISQPWLVLDCASETLTSVESGFIWLVEQAQMR